MAEPKLTRNQKGEPMHYSVGAVIMRNGKYLLMDRDMEPFGFAAVAGHIGDDETVEGALCRKICEESGLKIQRIAFLFGEEVPWNLCLELMQGRRLVSLLVSVFGRSRRCGT
ncbi:MAG: NUDIX hydrolase [Candidatus Liptonbacteria bacterium]|nr:NUDIX hydrolase [Candidatus Liptonbacteria bacterium]